MKGMAGEGEGGMPKQESAPVVNVNVEGTVISEEDLAKKVASYMETFRNYMPSPQR